MQWRFTVAEVSSDRWVLLGFILIQICYSSEPHRNQTITVTESTDSRESKGMGTNPGKAVFAVQGCREQSHLSLLQSPKVCFVLCNTICPSEGVPSVIIFAWHCGNPTQQDYFRAIPLCSVPQLSHTQLHWSLWCLQGSAQFIRDLGTWVERTALWFFFNFIIDIPNSDLHYTGLTSM